MAGGSIQEPGVEVIQEFVTTSPTIVAPTLPTALVGACIQVVDAFSDAGDPQADALAGTYRNGFGVISYDLPSLTPGALVTGLEDKIRVFLTYGDVKMELNSTNDEVVVDSGAAGSFTLSTLAFVQIGALWTQIGVEAGDVVRFTYQGETLDLKIASVDSDSQVTLSSAGPVSDASLSGLSFSIVRNPAQFLFSSGTQANFEIGDAADYLTVTTQPTGSYAGSLGDSLSWEVIDSQHYADGSDGATGGGIFSSAGATFGTSVGAVGSYPTDMYIFVGAAYGPGADPIYQIKSVVSETRLTVATGLSTGLSGQTYEVGTSVASGTNGSTDVTGLIFTSAGASFLTAIPNTGGVPNQPTLIEIAGDGVYDIANVDSATQLTLGTAASTGLSGQTYRVVAQTATDTDGATGSLTQFVSASGGLLSIPNTGGTPDQATYISGGQSAGLNRAVSAIVSDFEATVSSGFAASFSGQAWQAVDQNASLTLTFDPAQEKISIQIARINGVSSSTYAQIEDAITNDANPSYNETVAGIVTAAVSGSGTILGTDIAYGASSYSGSFDGGSDAQDLLLDADLLSSSTPTAAVFVSYRALRLDVSPAATGATLLEVSSMDDIETKLGVISPENPLALGAYFAVLNCPNYPIKVLGVSEISASKPAGTVQAYTEALEFLEGYDVYAIVPLTQDPTVHSLLQAHVDTLSLPANKSERIGLFNQQMPVYSKATVVASGVDGNTGATFTSSVLAEFSASVDFTAAGVQAGDLLVVSAISSSADSPDAVNGTIGPLYGIDILAVKPGDDFVLQLDGTQAGVSTDWNTLVDVSFTVYRAGVAISQPVDQAEQVAKIGEGIADRRMFHIWPDEAIADVGGTELVVPGYNVAAGWGGKVSAVAASQGLTNTTLVGFSGLRHSNGYFSRAQLDRMAGGGTMISVQDAPSAPIRCRHQLSTDVSTTQKRELSITKVVDYVSKIYRTALSSHVGKFNITQSYLDALTMIIHGLNRSVIESGTVRDAKLVELSVDDVQPDKINVKVAVLVLYPANYIVVTVQV